jgi:hypothetical protein
MGPLLLQAGLAVVGAVLGAVALKWACEKLTMSPTN